MQKPKSETSALFLTTLLTVSIMLFALHPVSAQQIPREKALYMYLGSQLTQPHNFNPYTSTEQVSSGLHSLEDLFYANQYTGEGIPWQAESFEYSPDKTQCTLHLRHTVKWNDGQPFTSEDVVFTYEMLIAHVELSYAPWVKENIASVEAVDDYTVLFTFYGPNPRAHYQMFYANWPIRIVPKHIWEGQDPATFTNYPNPVWTGAWDLVSAESTEVIMKRNDNWWGKDLFGLPEVEWIVWTKGGASLDEQISDATNNLMDWWGGWTKSTWDFTSAVNPDLSLWIFYDTCPRGLHLNSLVYPFNDSRVRWALSYCFNRDKYNEVVYEGQSGPAQHPFPPYPGVVGKFITPYQDVLDEYDSSVYNVTKTNEILTLLGWTKGTDGVWITNNGTRLGPYELPTWAQGGEGQLIAASLSEDMRAAGFDVTYKFTEWITFTDGIQRGLFPMWTGWACGLGISNAWDAWGLYIIFNSSYTDVPIGTKIALGMDTPGAATRWHTPEFDSILAQLTVMSPDDPAAAPLYRRALEIYQQNLPLITVMAAPNYIVTNNHYWTNWPSATNDYMHPYSHHSTFYYILTHLKSATAPPTTAPPTTAPPTTAPPTTAPPTTAPPTPPPTTKPPTTAPPTTAPPTTKPPTTAPPTTAPPTSPPPPPPADYTWYIIIGVIVVIVIAAIVILMRRK